MTTLPVYQTKVDSLAVNAYKNNEEMGRAAAAEAASVIEKAIAQKGTANIIIATGNSQLSFLSALAVEDGIDWSKVSVFHMDEYVDLPAGHDASFPKFLQKHLLKKVNAAAFYPVTAKTGELNLTVRITPGCCVSIQPTCVPWVSARMDTSPSTIRPLPSSMIRCWRKSCDWFRYRVISRWAKATSRTSTRSRPTPLP